MKESVTYQAIVAEGESEGARKELRKVLLSQGEIQFGAAAPEWAAAALDRIDSLERLEGLAKQILRVRSWANLLPDSRRLPRRKKGIS